MIKKILTLQVAWLHISLDRNLFFTTIIDLQGNPLRSSSLDRQSEGQPPC
jgi:hypothetical protein